MAVAGPPQVCNLNDFSGATWRGGPQFSVHRFNQHLTGPYHIQLFHKAQPTHLYMAQMLVIMDVRYDICKICMRYVAYSL